MTPSISTNAISAAARRNTGDALVFFWTGIVIRESVYSKGSKGSAPVTHSRVSRVGSEGRTPGCKLEVLETYLRLRACARVPGAVAAGLFSPCICQCVYFIAAIAAQRG